MPSERDLQYLRTARSEAARRKGIKVVLAGEVLMSFLLVIQDMLFDRLVRRHSATTKSMWCTKRGSGPKLWGDPNLFYEVDLYSFDL